MTFRVEAFYKSVDKARLAAEDLRDSGIPAGNIVIVSPEDDPRVEVAVRNFDEAINVQTFLREDGAASAEILSFPGVEEDETPTQGTIPSVPFVP